MLCAVGFPSSSPIDPLGMQRRTATCFQFAPARPPVESHPNAPPPHSPLASALAALARAENDAPPGAPSCAFAQRCCASVASRSQAPGGGARDARKRKLTPGPWPAAAAAPAKATLRRPGAARCSRELHPYEFIGFRRGGGGKSLCHVPPQASKAAKTYENIRFLSRPRPRRQQKPMKTQGF